MESPDGGRSTAGPVVEVKFSITDATYPFTGCALEADTTYELTDMVPREDGQCAEFFNVTGASPDRIVDAVSAFDGVEATCVSGYDDGGLFEFLVADGCPAFDLAERGAVPQTVRGADGTGRIVVEIPTYHEPAAVLESFLEEYPAADLVEKRRKEDMARRYSRAAFEQLPASTLTDRQREVLEAAFEAGYYEWPRECTGEELADELEIASATFSEHIHAAERNLLAMCFGADSDIATESNET